MTPRKRLIEMALPLGAQRPVPDRAVLRRPHPRLGVPA